MAALTNALQALGARAKQTIARRPNAVKALEGGARQRRAPSAELTQPGPQIDALLTAMSAVDAGGTRHRRRATAGCVHLLGYRGK